jgi:hypothetical protein
MLMTRTPDDVAALLRIVASESATLETLEACVHRLRDAQIAKHELARMPPATVLSRLLDRRLHGGDL